MTPALSGCLDAPPEYRVPDQVPPVIMTDDVLPSTSSVNHPSVKVDFTVPFRSDDAGEGLLAYFVRDIPSGKPSFGYVIDNPAIRINPDPRPFAEQDNRTFTFPGWTWTSDEAGCHTVTLILSHESNFNLRNGEVDVLEPTKAARTTWFFELSDPTASVSPSCGDWPPPAMAATP
jgi:hypothetical protein